jgi:hypothetical protein
MAKAGATGASSTSHAVWSWPLARCRHSAEEAAPFHRGPAGPRMAKKLELQESWQLSQSAWSHHALSATFFCGDRWRPLRTTGQMGELMEWARILAYISETMDQELLLRNDISPLRTRF